MAERSEPRLADLVREGDNLFISTGIGEPQRLLDELIGDVAPVRRRLNVFQVMTGASGRSTEVGRHGHRVWTVAASGSGDDWAIKLLDSSMGQVRLMIDRGDLPIDGVLISALRRGDRLFPVPATDLSLTAAARARFVAVQVYGDAPAQLRAPSLSVLDASILLVHDMELPEFTITGVTQVSEKIAHLVASVVPDGAILQLGVGQALAGIAEGLLAANIDVSIHSGLISDWAMDLVEAGRTHPLSCASGRTTLCAIAMGSRRFNEWVFSSGQVEFVGSQHAHDPGHLSRLSPFVAINSAMAVGLDGSVGIPPGMARRNGPGGLVDFAIGGAFGGLSIIALSARSSRGHDRIVPRVETVHLPHTLVTHVVTEFGVADLRGQTADERRMSIARLAHPDSRPALMDGGA